MAWGARGIKRLSMASQGPLAGVRVLDFTIFANGPSATM